MIASGRTEWMIFKQSPMYLKAYQEGYECAKHEMLQKIESMKALHECTNTMTIGEK